MLKLGGRKNSGFGEKFYCAPPPPPPPPPLFPLYTSLPGHSRSATPTNAQPTKIITLVQRNFKPYIQPTVNVTETCRFLNRRTAVVRLNLSLENVIRTLTPYMKNARSTVRQRRCVLRKWTYRYNYYCARRRYGHYVSNCFSARV